jgi:transposase
MKKDQAGEALRLAHDRELYREFLARLPPHSTIAVEASGSYCWLVDEMERSGHRPKLCNPLEAKRRMALTKKNDKLDARGLAILLRNGTLPEVWIPPSELRDQCELLRLRIFLVHLRTRVKNRIHGRLARHNVQIPGADLFGVAARLELGARLPELPPQSREAIAQELATLDFLETQIEWAERRLQAIMKVSVEADLLKTLPCVGPILSMVLMLENWPSRSVSDGGAFGQLRGSGAPRAFQRRPHTYGPGPGKCEPKPEMGFPRNSQPGCTQSAPTRGKPCGAALSTDQARQEPSKGGGRRRAPLG